LQISGRLALGLVLIPEYQVIALRATVVLMLEHRRDTGLR